MAHQVIAGGAMDQRLIKGVYDQMVEIIKELTLSSRQSKELTPSSRQSLLSSDGQRNPIASTSAAVRQKSNLKASRDKKVPEPQRGKVIVYVHAHVLKLGEIDTLQEKFHAELVVHSSWREPLLDGMITNQEFSYDKWDDSWNPEIFIENSFPETEERASYRLSYDKQGLAIVEERRVVKGKFFECLELFEYPFDKQELTVKVTTARSDDEVVLIAHPILSSSINVDCFTDRQQWKLQPKLKVWQTVRKDIYSSNDMQQPVLCITCQVNRLARFFLWNIILVMIFLGVLIFLTFAVTLDKVESRLVLSFILLLSNITFKFTVSKTIPKVPYLTYLDKYILLTIGLLCFIPIWHTVANVVSKGNKDLAKQLDNVAMGIIGVAYVVFNVAFFAVAMTKRKKRPVQPTTQLSSKEQR